MTEPHPPYAVQAGPTQPTGPSQPSQPTGSTQSGGPAQPAPTQPGDPGRRPDPEQTERARAALLGVRREVGKAVVGQDAAVTGMIIALLTRGHVLLEGVPGVAKTLLVRSIAASLSIETRRVQFTPDLMPGDITGSLVYDNKTSDFAFRPGPVFTNLLLADEINRTPPKTQSALLEAMQERQVTVEGTTFPLPRPFHVVATANPVEYEGTYPLPEAQLDRFLTRVSFGYPTLEEESDVLRRRVRRRQEETALPALLDAEQLLALQRTVEQVDVEPTVIDYCVRLAAATREHPLLQLGSSPRGSLALMLMARAIAVLRGRDYVVPEDVKAVAVPVLAHRVSLRPELWMSEHTTTSAIRGLVGEVPAPPTVDAGEASA